MQQITLLFPGAYALWKFKQICKLRSLEVNCYKYALTGQFQRADIDMAVKNYGATVLETASNV